MYYCSRAIIIKTMDLRETDKLVTLFSEKEGKIKAVAKGVKKPASSLRACVQPFCHSLLFFSSGRELDLITQGKLLDFYSNIREHIDLILYSVYIMELLDKNLMERVSLPGLYVDVLSVLEYINDIGYNPLAIRFLEMNLLKNLGYQPVLDECVFCGRKGGLLRNFSIEAGGTVCDMCVKCTAKNFPLSGELLALIRLLGSKNLKTVSRVKATDATLQQLEIFLEKYLEYHLERKFSVKNMISKLKHNRLRIT
ncbi:MAG: DNA repair protein RecO [Syntrophomonadaceae bacterium]|nr:DNA repair protein RecO [Syntrophomonadaceae bacterium]